MKTICGEYEYNFDASSHGVIVGFGLVLIPGLWLFAAAQAVARKQ